MSAPEITQLRAYVNTNGPGRKRIPNAGSMKHLLDEIDARGEDAKWLLSEFALDHWQSCDIPDEEDGGCYLCHGYREMRDRYGK
jgi:hypothetical protein